MATKTDIRNAYRSLEADAEYYREVAELEGTKEARAAAAHNARALRAKAETLRSARHELPAAFAKGGFLFGIV